MFGTNSGCDCHFSDDTLIIQKDRFLYIVVSYRLVFTRLLLTGTLCGLVCRVVRFSTGSFVLNGSREYLWPVMIALRAESTSICPLTALPNA